MKEWKLFTGNNLMVMAFASGCIRLREIFRVWAIVYMGNFVGATGVALLVFLATGYTHRGGTVGIEAVKSADGKASLSALQALIHGILANTLVCLATWLCFSARSTTDKILAIVLPIAAFSAAGFEHLIANMYLLSFAVLTKYAAPLSFWSAIGMSSSTFSHLNMIAALMNECILGDARQHDWRHTSWRRLLVYLFVEPLPP